MDVGHKRSLTSVWKRIAEEGGDVVSLKARIHDLFIKTIITGYPTLSSSVSSVHPDNFANDMCFEILGFDIMLDHKLNPCLLEINYTPSFTADTPLDRHIKKNLIADTLQLLNVTDKWKKDMKIRRDKETQERMVSGKRRKYTPEERIALSLEESKRRDEH
jgi:tubulin polyglutamylase TTLL6/13